MSKPEWGVKRTCQSCSAVFYDMKKDPIICPKCKTVYDLNALLTVNPIDGSAKESDDTKAGNQDDDYQFDDDLFLDSQKDYLEDLEDLEELEDHLEPSEIIPRNA